jgi:outer membrane protein TolC
VRFQRENQWTAGVQIVQSVFEGGRIRSSLRAARLTREQAELQYQAAVADTVLHIRTGFYDVLLAARQIQVQEESLQLLQEELKNAKRREDAGAAPHFNVLRAEVEVANARPSLIRAQNAHRIAKINFANLLGYDVPAETWNDIPLQLVGGLEAPQQTIQLAAALEKAAERRPELAALRKAEALRREGITSARAGNLPSIQVFAGHNWRSSTFQDDLAADISGWNAGAQVTWNFFDGMLTYGKIREAKALHQKAEVEIEDATRRVALEVRTAYSGFIEATEVLESQAKAIETAEEALRLANVRAEAGAGIQLDVLSARTALTQARTTRNLAQRDYLTALARLERAVGIDVQEQLPPAAPVAK